MIKEEYVSVEVAKLLKEKGFSEPTMGTYNIESKNPILVERPIRAIHCEAIISAPTQVMAMKWLREEHNIMISPYALSLGWYFEIFDLTKRDITGCKPIYKIGIPNKTEVMNTYELAVEAALKYSLENLI